MPFSPKVSKINALIYFKKSVHYFSTLFLLLTTSCKDESIPIEENQNPKALIDQKILKEIKAKSKSAISTSKIDEFELIWGKATVKKYSFGEGIIVPIKYKNPKKPLYYIDEVKNKGKNKKLISTLSNSDLDYMFIRLDENRRVIKKFVSIIPDQDYLIRSKNMKLKNVEFDGLKIVKDENGKIEFGFKYVKNIKSKNEKNSKNAKINGEWCYTVDYYSCFSSDGGGSEDCQYNFSDTFCFYYSDFDSTPEPGNGQGGGDGGNGSGGGGGATDPYQTLNDLINSSNSSSDLLSSDLLEDNGTTRRKKYVWKAVNGLTWNINSYDTGTHTKVGGEWHWSSLEHNNLGFEGYVVGGTMDYERLQTMQEVGIFYALIEHTIQLNFAVGIGDVAFREGKIVSSPKYLYVND